MMESSLNDHTPSSAGEFPSKNMEFKASSDDNGAQCSVKISPDLPEATEHRASSGYEYLDHPADVQLHAWGGSLEEAFEQAVLAMFGYMTDLDTVDGVDVRQLTAEGHDACSLLYNLLDEFLFAFSAEPNFVACRVNVFELDRSCWRARAHAHGETFRLDKHPQGTEVKAITYSNLQVHDEPDRHEVFVILDI